VVAELGGVLLESPIEGWFQLGVTAAGGEHTVTFDGATVLTAADPDPLPSGGIAFEVLGGATAPPEVLPTPTPAPAGGRGICGGLTAIPLGLVGLVWINRRRR
jgi:hypothetical protein